MVEKNNIKNTPIIAIDGPSAAGKGTLAKRLAAYFDFDHMDTGATYRIVALKLIEEGYDYNNVDIAKSIAENLDYSDYNKYIHNPSLRTEKTSFVTPIVAAMPPVRKGIFHFQRNFGLNPPNGCGAVLDGRDIGTVVLPEADAKFFVTADNEIRAKRRYEEQIAKGLNVTYEEILGSMVIRDEKDKNRKTAPTKKAEDAFLLDTTDLTPDEVFDIALKFVDSKGIIK